MLECRSCLLRQLRAVAGEGSVATRLQQNPLILTPRLALPSSRRKLATASDAALRKDSAKTSRVSSSKRDPEAVKSDESNTAIAKSERRALHIELSYLKDPKKLADHIHYVLRCDKPEKALEMCRMASKSQSCVVAWNHTIDWHMQHGKVNEAIKIYNEMKKRAQFPDSHTYMALFRGFPQHRTHHGPEVKAEFVSKAVSMYNSMQTPNSRVKPNIMHANAVLRVCSLAKDMDALWNVAGQLPEHGPGSPDHITYTILLDAVRFSAFGADNHVNLDQVSELRQRAVNEGRRIWRDVVSRWRAGEVVIDNQLTCAMASILLISKRMEDWDDVLNLIQQTTNIKRLVEPLGSSRRMTEHVPRSDEEDMPVEAEEDSEGWLPTPAADVFKQAWANTAGAQDGDQSSSVAYVEPTEGVLNAAIEACKQMRTAQTAYAYWDTLVDKGNVTPSLETYRLLLSVMSINRSSGRAARLLQDLHSKGLELRNMLFRQAMNTCRRDIKNPNVLKHAQDVIDVMGLALPHPDFQTLHGYLSIAQSTKDPKDVVAALDQLTFAVNLLRDFTTSSSVVKFGSQAKDFVTHADAVELYQSMIGAVDSLVNHDLVSASDSRRLLEQRTELAKLVGRLANNVHGRRDGQQRQRRAINDYREGKKALHAKKEELASMGVVPPSATGQDLRMSQSEWQALVARGRRVKDSSKSRPGTDGEAQRIFRPTATSADRGRSQPDRHRAKSSTRFANEQVSARRRRSMVSV